MPASRAFVIKIESVGLYVDPGTSGNWLDLHFSAALSGDDGKIKTHPDLTAKIDPANSPAQMAAAIAAAVSTWAAALGYTLAANQIFVPTWTRI